MSLYFGNLISFTSTLLILSILTYITLTFSKRKTIQTWGRQVLLVSLWGLLICIFVATRDSYHLSVQASLDGVVAPGLFTINSLQSKLCCAAGVIIAFSSLSSLFIRKQHYWQVMFYILSLAIIF